MPEEAMASAISRTDLSSTLPANSFQLFQPMGGVLARPLGGMGLKGGNGACGLAALKTVSELIFLRIMGAGAPPRPPPPRPPRPACAAAAMASSSAACSGLVTRVACAVADVWGPRPPGGFITAVRV